jgi:hypothetical protein
MDGPVSLSNIKPSEHGHGALVRNLVCPEKNIHILSQEIPLVKPG